MVLATELHPRDPQDPLPWQLWPSLRHSLENPHLAQSSAIPSSQNLLLPFLEQQLGVGCEQDPAAVKGNTGVLSTHGSLAGIHNLIKTFAQERFDIHGEVLERGPGSCQSSKNNKALAIMGVLRLRKTGMNSQPS